MTNLKILKALVFSYAFPLHICLFPSIIIMMVFLIVFVLVVVPFEAATTIHNDACHYIHPSSICSESGICTHTAVTCTDAYILSSRDMLIERNEMPLTPEFDFATHTTISQMRQRRGSIAIQPDWLLYESYENLNFYLKIFAQKFQSQFPLIIVDIPFLQHLVDRAAQFGEDVVEPLFNEQHNPANNIALYYMSVVENCVLSQISVHFEVVKEYLISLDFRNPLRRAILAHLTPYAHALLRVHEHMRIPAGMQSLSWMEILEFMSRHDPIYPNDDEDKIWTIPIISGVYPPLSIPIVVSETEPIPLPILESVEEHSSNITESISAILGGFRMTEATRPRFHSVYENLRRELYYIFFALTKSETLDFCRTTKPLWSSFFQILEPYSGRNTPLFLVHLFRICGSDYLPLEDRAWRVLPSLVGRRATPGKSIHYQNGTFPLPINVLRNGVDISWNPLGNKTWTHTTFLSIFVESGIQKRPTEPRRLYVLGSAIALLVIEGDPHGTLQNHLSKGHITDFYLESVSVKRGFCEVMNCIIFDVLFHQTEFVNLLKYLRNGRPLLGARVQQPIQPRVSFGVPIVSQIVVFVSPNLHTTSDDLSI